MCLCFKCGHAKWYPLVIHNGLLLCNTHIYTQQEQICVKNKTGNVTIKRLQALLSWSKWLDCSSNIVGELLCIIYHGMFGVWITVCIYKRKCSSVCSDMHLETFKQQQQQQTHTLPAVAMSAVRKRSWSQIDGLQIWSLIFALLYQRVKPSLWWTLVSAIHC